jgi:8-oxo-(d)GTP phosphatase
MRDGHDNGVIHAAGALVWRPGTLGPELALVHRPQYDDWSYPKGKCHREEHVLTAAIREVTEETGLRVILGRPLTPSDYEVGGRPKQVSYWAARPAESLGFTPNSEVDQVTWLPADKARERLSYQRDVALVDELRSRPLSTSPFILVRHASAGRKSAGRVSDLARPLDPRGAADAELLAGLLASYGPCRVISSGAERCLGTVRPYAAAMGVPVEVEPAFTLPADDGLAGAEIRNAGASRAAALAAAGGPTLICGHRENLPSLIDAAFGELGADPPAAPRPLAKAAFWVLHSAGGVLVSAERHDAHMLRAPRSGGMPLPAQVTWPR